METSWILNFAFAWNDLYSYFARANFGLHKKEEPDDGIGPGLNDVVIAGAIDQAHEDKSLLDAHVGDWVLYETWIQPFTAQPTYYGARAQTIESRKDIGEFVEFVIRTIKYDEDDKVTSDSAETCKISKITFQDDCKSINSSASADVAATSEPISPRTLTPHKYSTRSHSIIGPYLQQLASDTKVTFHNFTWTVGEMAPSSYIVEQPNCSGVPNCMFRKNTISFDIISESESLRERQNVVMVLSADAPYLGIPISTCVKMTQEFEGRAIPVTQCTVLSKLKYGAKKASTVSDVESLIKSALKDKNLYSVKKDETVTVIQRDQTGNGDARLHLQNKSVVERTELSTSSATLKIKNVLETLDRQFLSTMEDTCTSNSDGTHSCRFSPLPHPGLKRTPGDQVEIRNVTSVNYLMTPPNSIIDSPICEGREDCKINGTVIRFERWEKFDGFESSTIHYLEVSPEASSLGAITFGCSRGIERVGALRMSTQQCQVLF